MKTLPRRPAAEGIAQPLLVPHASLAPDPEQPRRSGLDQGLAGLLESIRAHGVIQPILVRPHPDPAARAATPYMIVLGERRWTAAGRAGRDEVPVFLLDRPLSPGDRLMLQIEENDGDNRQDLSLYDLATAVARAVKLEGVSQAQFALRHRRSTAWVSQLLALANAGGLLGEALREGRLRGRLVARTFQRLPEHHQRELLAHARRHNTPISLAAAEKLANRAERQAHPATEAAGNAGVVRPANEAAALAAPPTAAVTVAAAGPIGGAVPIAAAARIAAASPVGSALPAAPPDSQATPIVGTAETDVPTAGGAAAAPARPATMPISVTAVTPPSPTPAPTLPVDAGGALDRTRSGRTTSDRTESDLADSARTGSDRTEADLRVCDRTASDCTASDSTAAGRTPSGPAPAALLHYRATSTRPSAAVQPGTTRTGTSEPSVPLLATTADAGTAAPAPAVAAPAQPAPPPASATRAGGRDPANPSVAATSPLSPPAAGAPSHPPRSAAAGLLAAASPFVDPFAAGRPVAGDAVAVTDSHLAATGRITVELSFAQLQKLLRLLGHEPAATPPALVHQLLTAL